MYFTHLVPCEIIVVLFCRYICCFASILTYTMEGISYFLSSHYSEITVLCVREVGFKCGPGAEQPAVATVSQHHIQEFVQCIHTNVPSLVQFCSTLRQLAIAIATQLENKNVYVIYAEMVMNSWTDDLFAGFSLYPSLPTIGLHNSAGCRLGGSHNKKYSPREK